MRGNKTTPSEPRPELLVFDHGTTRSIGIEDASRLQDIYTKTPSATSAPNVLGGLKTMFRLSAGIITYVIAYSHVASFLNLFSTFIFGFFVGGPLVHRTTILVHHLGHRSVFPSERFNVALGVMLSSLIWTNYFTISARHNLHHEHNGQTGDPEAFAQKDFHQSSLLTKFLFFTGPIFDYFKTPEPTKKIVQNRFRTIERSAYVIYVCSTFILQLLLLILLQANGSDALDFIFLHASLLPAGIMFSRFRGILEHMPGFDAKGIAMTRTHIIKQRLLLSYFFGGDMNYHVEHHLAPWLPSYSLSEFSELIRPILPARSTATDLQWLIRRA